VAYDQPDNARRAVALGLARSIPIRKVTATGLAAELGALLADPACAASAQAAAAGLEDGAGRAADALLASIS
jgi:UDP:flavonoid glycosyltransferase YjiC (YdhE family)